MGASITTQALLGLLLLFSMLLSTGTSLQCETCNEEGTTCTGDQKNCTEVQDACMFLRTIHTSGVQRAEKSCIEATKCKELQGKVGIPEQGITIQSIECSRASLIGASLLLALSGLPLLKILL